MNRFTDWERFDEDAEDRPSRRAPRAKRKRSRAEIVADLAEADDPAESEFNPSFTASRHEKRWIQEHLGPFFDDHLITDVLHTVKGGKEATVYCCRAHPSTGEKLLAAKVYRPREFRSMRNDALYREGRMVTDQAGKEVRDRRALHAVAKKSQVGLQILHATWLGQEYETLHRLHKAGADVPRPFAKEGNAILMTYLGDESGAAPALHGTALPPHRARPVFEALLENVELMLGLGCIHGDLSAYNVLYWEDLAVIIDFPQAVDPFKNPRAFALFDRDVTRLCQYFRKQGIEADPERLVRGIWARQVHPQHDGTWSEG
jgi:RIO kinase 1